MSLFADLAHESKLSPPCVPLRLTCIYAVSEGVCVSESHTNECHMPLVVLLKPHLTTRVNAPLIGSKCVVMYYLHFVEGCWHMQLDLFPKSPYKCSLPQNEHFLVLIVL